MKKICLILIMSLFLALVCQADFISDRVHELQNDIAQLVNSIQEAQLEMRRLNYNYLTDEIMTLEEKLQKVLELSQSDSGVDEAILLLGDVTFKLKEIQPFLYESLPVETRAIWMDRTTIERFYNKSDIQKHLDQLQSININLIFLEVYHNGVSIYPSEVVTFDEKIQFMYRGDLLNDIITEAHLRNMEIHPSVRVFGLHYGAEHFINDKLHWLDKTKTNSYTLSNGFYWLCSVHPEVREFMIAMLKELTQNYNIDGMHLDYIRFDNDFGYNQYSRDLFKSLFGVDPFDITSFEMQDTFTVFKTQFINKFVERTYTELKAIKPELILSAAVSTPFTWVKLEKAQDWPTWAQNRIIHFATPMAYRNTAREYSSVINSDLSTISGSTHLFPGLGVYLFDDITLLEQIKAGQDTAVTGQAIFSATNMKNTQYTVLQKGPWSKPAVPTFRDPQYAAHMILKDLYKRIEELGYNANIAASLSSEYINLIKTLSNKILRASLRKWDLRDLRVSSQEEAAILEEILTELSILKDRFVDESTKLKNLTSATSARIIRDIEQVESLLFPLLYTSQPFEYTPTTIL